MKRWKRGFSGSSVHLLIDTQVLVWLLSGDRRLRQSWTDQLSDPNTIGYVSAVIAWEYSDLSLRGWLPIQEDVAQLQALFGLKLLDYPAEGWMMAARLPDIHRDPVDRMLIAHALLLDMTLVTADAAIRSYPVKSLW